MNVIVCVKQVPDTTEIKINPVKNTLIGEGVPSILNPFDGYAPEAAARIKNKDPSAKLRRSRRPRACSTLSSAA